MIASTHEFVSNAVMRRDPTTFDPALLTLTTRIGHMIASKHN